MESTLGLSLVANSPKKARGLNGIGKRASRMVRNMAFLLERENSKRNLSFVTVTLPELSRDDHDSVLENWGAIVKEYFKILGRKYEKSSGRKFEHVSVTEVQEKRFERTGFIGLHIHTLFVGRTNHKSAWILTPIDIRDSWEQAVAKHCKGVYEFGSSENCQSVRRSAEGYLGKYLTKGSKAVKAIISKGYAVALPKAWYSRSLSLHRRVKQRIRRDYRAGNFLSRRFARRLTLNTVFMYREITIETPSMGERVIGYVGKFKRSIDIYGAKDIMELLTRFEADLCTNQ